MSDFDKRIGLAMGIFGAVLAPLNLFSGMCVLIATAIWIARSVSPGAR